MEIRKQKPKTRVVDLRQQGGTREDQPVIHLPLTFSDFRRYDKNVEQIYNLLLTTATQKFCSAGRLTLSSLQMTITDEIMPNNNVSISKACSRFKS